MSEAEQIAARTIELDKGYDPMKNGVVTFTLNRKPNIYWRIKIKVMNFFSMPRSKITWEEDKK